MKASLFTINYALRTFIYAGVAEQEMGSHQQKVKAAKAFILFKQFLKHHRPFFHKNFTD